MREMSQSPTAKEHESPRKKKPLFVSPRLKIDDEEFDKSRYRTESRWRRIAEQAGIHQQDLAVLTIHRSVSPIAFRYGMIRQACIRVRFLNLSLEYEEDILPEWMDVLSTTLENLEHLTISYQYKGEQVEVNNRMKRLYILYRMPTLKSIDNTEITSEERETVGNSVTSPKESVEEFKEGHEETILSGNESLLDNCTTEDMGIEFDHDVACQIALLDINSTSQDFDMPLQENQSFHENRHRITVESHDMPVKYDSRHDRKDYSSSEIENKEITLVPTESCEECNPTCGLLDTNINCMPELLLPFYGDTKKGLDTQGLYLLSPNRAKPLPLTKTKHFPTDIDGLDDDEETLLDEEILRLRSDSL